MSWPALLTIPLLSGAAMLAAQANAAGPVIVVETTKGTFAFETYPREAPKTVAHVVALVRRGFYDGQRVHRAVPGFLVQWGDPRSRDRRYELTAKLAQKMMELADSSPLATHHGP